MTARRVLLGVALLTVAIHVALELAGGRQMVSVLSGATMGGPSRALLGVGYALSHFAFVIVAPILVITAALDRALDRLRACDPRVLLRAHEREAEDRGARSER